MNTIEVNGKILNLCIGNGQFLLYLQLSIRSMNDRFGLRKVVKSFILERTSDRGIRFKFFSSIDYYKKQTSLSTVTSDNKALRLSVQRFYNEQIPMLFFVEQHSGGGYHRHVLIADASEACWKSPPRRVERWLLEKDPAAVFAIRMGEEPSDDQKLALLNRVLRMEPSVPNGELGLKTELIYDQDHLSGMYLTKQCGKQMEGISFLDVENSDLRPNTSKSYAPVLQAK